MTVLFFPLLAGMAHAAVLPHDPPTIEALIDQHRKTIKAEDESNVRITSNMGLKMSVKKAEVLYDSLRTILDRKSNDVFSYIVLGSELSRCALSTVKLMDEYKEFTEFAMKAVQRKPIIAWYVYQTNDRCCKEIKNIEALYVTVSASGFNVIRSTNKEKLSVIYSLEEYVEKLRGILYDAHARCTAVDEDLVRADYIWEILNSGVLERIGGQVIRGWGA